MLPDPQYPSGSISRNNALHDPLRHFLDNIPDYAFFLLDPAGMLTHWSGSAEQLFGYTADQLRGRHFSFLYARESTEGRNPDQELQMASAHGRFEDTHWRARSNGSRFWAESVLCPVRGADGELRGFTHVIRDITDRRKAELALRQKEEELLQARKMEAIGRLVGGVAHDFNNFITGIIGLAEEIHESFDLTDTRRPDMADIIKLANRASALTRELLAFSRKQASSPQVISLNAMILDKKNILLRLLGADIQLETVFAQDIGHVLLDPRQLDQILVNLVMNARDAMPTGGRVVIETRRTELANDTVSGMPAGPYVALRISDTGCGIEPDVQNHIFEPFFTTKKQGKGTGLGLSTVFGIVKQHRGHISVDSKPDQGTQFTILWPEIDMPKKAENDAVPLLKPNAHSETILLVEDEETLRLIAQRALEKSGYRVLTAASGPLALTLARDFKEPIHLLVTDVMMTPMNGRTLASEFQRDHPHTPVLYMSAYSEEITHQQGIPEKDLEFIEKPFTQKSLVQKISQVLENHHR